MLAAALAIAILGNEAAAAGNSPDATCSLSGSVLNIKIREWGDQSFFRLTRHADALVLREQTGLNQSTTIPCTGGTPTVNSVESVSVGEKKPPGSYDKPSASSFGLDMSHGAFAPDGGRPDITSYLNLPGAVAWIAAPPGRNFLGVGGRHHDLALQVARSRRPEVEMRKLRVVEVFAGAGADLIDAKRSPDIRPRRPDLVLWGNGGDDRLVGGGKRDALEGGHGADVLSGRAGAGQIRGGSGPDRLLAGNQSTILQGDNGRDNLKARNGHHDWISCGPGDDRATADPREEAMGGCEHAPPNVHTRF
jgi:hypothetical protein